MQTFKQFLKENHGGHFIVSGQIPGSNGPKRIEDLIYRPKDFNRDAVRNVFFARHVPKDKLRNWITQYARSATVRWIEEGKPDIDNMGWLNFPIVKHK